MVLDLDIVRKGPYVFKAGLVLGLSSLGVVLLTAQPDLFDYLAIINQIK